MEDFRRLFDILPYQAAKYPQKVAIAHRHLGRWQTFSTQELIKQIQYTAAGLLDLGLKKGQKVAILANHGSAWWNILDMALHQVGLAVVPIHATTTPFDLEYILHDSEAVYCFVGGEELKEKAREATQKVPSVKELFSLEPMEGLHSLQDLQTTPLENHLAQLETYRAVIHEDDPCTIIYTSGTTGRPKGVLLSHKNIISNIKATIALIPVNRKHQVISYLPLSHVFERMVIYTYMAVGASIYYTKSINHLIKDLREIRPHYLTSVPRLLEKVQKQVVQAAMQKTWPARKTMLYALKFGRKYSPRKKRNPLYWLQWQLLRILVYRKWKKFFGRHLKGIFVGAAPLQPELARLFSAAGIEVREGYGLTETSPVISFNQFNKGMYRFGTVGVPIPGVEVRIQTRENSDSGEICVRGPNVMLGYHKLPEETAAAIDQDGWFHTGDEGRWVDRRFLQITGRIKDLFKTSSGKYISPLKLEERLKRSPWIEQCIVIGTGRPFPLALIVPCFPLLEDWCKENEVHWTAPIYMVHNPRVLQKMRNTIEEINQEFEPHEQIRDLLLLPEEWTTENELLTPTLKPIRYRIEKQYQKDIDKIYEKHLPKG